LILTNANNTWPGGERIAAGTLQSASLAEIGPGPVTLSGGGLYITSGGSFSTVKDLTISAAGTGITQAPGGFLEWTGVLRGGANLVLNGGVFNPDQTIVATQPWTGNHIINNATLMYTHARGLGTVPVLAPGYFTLNNGTLLTQGFLDGASVNQSIAAYSTLRGITVNGQATLDVRQGNLTTAYGVTFGQVIAGTGTVNYVGGANTNITVSGANTYTGKTTINSPQFFFTADSNFGTVPAAVMPTRSRWPAATCSSPPPPRPSTSTAV